MGKKYQSWAERWGTERRPRERRKPASDQLTLDSAKTLRGGIRKGAGRPKTLRPKVSHRARTCHSAYTPVHVTLRRAYGLPDFRFARLLVEIVRCIKDSQRDDFRIIHYSIQSDHVHLIVEAESEALERGMRGFTIRTAKGLNKNVLKRQGKVWEDRFHRHDLRTPTEVRNALVYVLGNGAKHGVVPRGQIDPCSSGRYFTGWNSPIPDAEGDIPVRPPQTWLLAKSWMDVGPGYIFFTEVPKAARK